MTPVLPSQEFDPLVELSGCWTTALAERYLPVRELAGARHECVAGRLVISPFLRASESFAMVSLGCLLAPAAEAAGRHVLGRVNLTVSPGLWIQPDVTVLHTLPATDEEDRWVPAGHCELAVEVSSDDNPGPAAVDRPRRCAEGGVPWFMRVRLTRDPARVDVRLLALHRPGGPDTVARAVSGERLRADAPFPIDFDPAELLP
ncbi:hypothetical protein TK50_16625 [Micromonospora haikouensis]|uniref:Restriction endonuclease n=1 Tax=Micromonospora haikouensis TaxID=686309 RepID=A0A0D0WVJ4_9ACTN|nr:hypothetical protein TK50_16625 [Micromonospora haikouensis]